MASGAVGAPQVDVGRPAKVFAHTSVALGTCALPPAPLPLPMVFVLSSPRSGSTVFQLSLNAHPQLYAGQELYLLMCAAAAA